MFTMRGATQLFRQFCDFLRHFPSASFKNGDAEAVRPMDRSPVTAQHLLIPVHSLSVPHGIATVKEE
jgi:hypothetical protein